MKYCNPFVADRRALEPLVRRALRRLPPLSGDPIRVGRETGLCDRHGDSHAVTFLRGRRILFDCRRAEFPRVFVHEVFHFVWLRAGNAARDSFGQLLAAEIERGARGELGWSAEWRKLRLTDRDRRSARAAGANTVAKASAIRARGFSRGMARHDEFTLAKSCRKVRRNGLSGPSAGAIYRYN